MADRDYSYVLEWFRETKGVGIAPTDIILALSELDALRAAVRRVTELCDHVLNGPHPDLPRAQGERYVAAVVRAALGEPPPPADTSGHYDLRCHCGARFTPSAHEPHTPDCRFSTAPSAGGSTPDPADTSEVERLRGLIEGSWDVCSRPGGCIPGRPW